ncbi:hypothetical protein [uncultured Megasphaera sp.]|uniref:hypothetical protein n=1 Tax=uncultured Megasphaera sp. TaxID=165188 RepID=UPI0025D8A17C|nr:hypothetical protein [uncultured Megasphaera sp.]
MSKEYEDDKYIESVEYVKCIVDGKPVIIPVTRYKKYACDFSNLYDFIYYLYMIAERHDLHEIDCFVDKEYSEYKEEFPTMYDAENIQRYVIDFLDGYPGGWLNFDQEKLAELLKKPFFDGYFTFIYKSLYNKVPVSEIDKARMDYATKMATQCAKGDVNDIFSLILYTFTKVQGIAVKCLPKNRSEMVWYFLCYQDLIEGMMTFSFYEIVATIYKKWGVKWFCHDNRSFDSVLYKWACYGVIACKYTQMLPKEQLKKDLSDLYSELLILSVRSDSLDRNKEYLEYIKNAINHFDDMEIESLKSKMKKMEHKELQLLNDKETLEKSYAVLQQELTKLQKDPERTDDEKAKGILNMLYDAMPEKDIDMQAVKNISEIWDRLDSSTRKDIKFAIDMFYTYKRTDIPSFLLISCIENELNRNYFTPFKESKFYNEISDTNCLKKKYQRVHDALYDQRVHPTMGAIPFVGRAVKSPKGSEASMVIAKFAEFLAEEKSYFCKICEDVDKYRVGLNNFSLIRIRNGIAHGDTEVKEKCDASCFSAVKKFVCDPPLQIMILIIMHSKRKD